MALSWNHIFDSRDLQFQTENISQPKVPDQSANA